MHDLSQQKFCYTCKGKRRVWILEHLKRTFSRCPECEGVGFVTLKPEVIDNFKEIEDYDLQRQNEGQDEGWKREGQVLNPIKPEVVVKKRGRPAKRK